MIVSSPFFKGNAELLYDRHGKLILINLHQAEMSIKTTAAFKANVPVMLEDLFNSKIKDFEAIIVEKDFEVSFDMFWNKYDKKINRKRCVVYWERLSKTEQVSAYVGITKYFTFLGKTDWRQKLDPENYLKNHSWENEWK